MGLGSDGVLIALVLSLCVNVAAVVVAWPKVRRKLLARRPPDYAELARQRFHPAPDGAVVFAGDSHVGNAPLLDMLTDYRQMGIGGQTVSDVARWLPTMVGGARRVVLSAGTNDVLLGTAPAVVVERLAALVRALGDREVVAVALPPLQGHETAVEQVNDGLRNVCPVVTLNLPGDWTDDGVHLTRDAYLAVAGQVAG